MIALEEPFGGAPVYAEAFCDRAVGAEFRIESAAIPAGKLVERHSSGEAFLRAVVGRLRRKVRVTEVMAGQEN